MRPLTLNATRALAAVALAAMPAIALAQTSQAPSQPNPAADHLRAARSALNKVLNTPAPAGDTFKKLSELKTEYIALEKAASTASPQWAAHYAAADRIVGDLIGGSSASAEPGAIGTSGRKGVPPAKGLDPALVANLQEFRTHLSAFSTAMAAVAPAPSATAPKPSAPEPATAAPPAAAPPAPATPPTEVAPPNPPAPTTAASSSVAPGAPAPSDASVVAQLDAVTALVDSALAANAQATTIAMDRATLEQIKSQLAQIKQRVKQP
jgi:hypothetical protein